MRLQKTTYLSRQCKSVAWVPGNEPAHRRGDLRIQARHLQGRRINGGLGRQYLHGTGGDR